MERHGSRLYAMLTRLTLSEHAAEDLLQELFISLSRSDRLSEADDPVAYAYRVAMNLAADWRRNRKPVHSLSDLDEEPTSTALSSLAQLIQQEKVRRVLDATAELPSEFREVFVMRHIQQDSYETIAGRLGKTSHQARALCSRAVSRLRTVINGHES